jgi:hypothetical protein
MFRHPHPNRTRMVGNDQVRSLWNNVSSRGQKRNLQKVKIEGIMIVTAQNLKRRINIASRSFVFLVQYLISELM